MKKTKAKKKTYEVIIEVPEHFRGTVEAKTMNEARKKAKEDFVHGRGNFEADQFEDLLGIDASRVKVVEVEEVKE